MCGSCGNLHLAWVLEKRWVCIHTHRHLLYEDRWWRLLMVLMSCQLPWTTSCAGRWQWPVITARHCFLVILYLSASHCHITYTASLETFSSSMVMLFALYFTSNSELCTACQFFLMTFVVIFCQFNFCFSYMPYAGIVVSVWLMKPLNFFICLYKCFRCADSSKFCYFLSQICCLLGSLQLHKAY